MAVAVCLAGENVSLPTLCADPNFRRLDLGHKEALKIHFVFGVTLPATAAEFRIENTPHVEVAGPPKANYNVTADSVSDREAMCIALERLRVHRQYVEVIRDSCADQTFVIKGITGDIVKDVPHTGIRQGYPLSPYLFIMVMTVLFHDVDTRLHGNGVPMNTWSVGKPIYDLEYTMIFSSSRLHRH